LLKVDATGKEKVVHNFGSFAGDGLQPWAGLIRDAAGRFYGTTIYGGRFGEGTVFRLDKNGKVTVLYSFTGFPDGAQPY
jgi:uncharacterized repeat protein (TIGR03803 family)